MTDRHEEVPSRWEWRVFGRHVALPPGTRPPQTDAPASDETYLVSFRSTDNVKVRGGRLEMKRLEETGTAGLELWNPVLSVSLPASPAALETLWERWGVQPPREPAVSLDTIVRAVVAATPWLRAIAVTKRRVALALEECRGEFVELHIGGERWESVAIESEDPMRVLAAVRRLGLHGMRNTSYPVALARIAGASEQPVSPMQEAP
jgi:hypothetical protein